MPSFPDTAVLVVLALLLFGPKKLPVLARQLGKLMADFRRASNEFRAQMDEELRISEEAERQKQIAAIEAAAPAAPAIAAPPESSAEATTPAPAEAIPTADISASASDPYSHDYGADSPEPTADTVPAPASEASPEPAPAPAPIATSGELSILPPATGLPTPSSSPTVSGRDPQSHLPELETETLHG